MTEAAPKRIGTYRGIPLYSLDGAPDFAILSKINAGLKSEAWHIVTWHRGALRQDVFDPSLLVERDSAVVIA